MTSTPVPASTGSTAFLLAVVFVAAIVASGVFFFRRVTKRRSDCWPRERNDNGIRVGAPKVYDNRSLSLMLEELQNQLKALQSIDVGSLKGSLGTQQGERTSSVDATAGLTLPSPTAPAAATASTAKPDTAAAPLKWSERAADLLEDQVNLSYQIFNLRLLLERAISDRLTDDGKPRLQAVIALPISIDPPDFAVGCAATVEVRLAVDPTSDQQANSAQARDRRPSLVALFPQEETYNTWSVSRRGLQASVNAGSGAVAASGGATGSSSASYILRQADIVAVEREPAEKQPAEQGPAENGLTVAWQFRPSAGERSVKAGLRQVLAVLALPRVDEGTGYVKVAVGVRSSWQTWDAKTAMAGNGAGWRALFSDRPTRHAFGSHGSVSVPAADVLDTKLAPQIRSIQWFRIGRNSACVTVNGKNFFTGTTAVMGDTVFGADNGLTIKSERTLQIVVPVAALLSDALLNGRYGQSLPMARPPQGIPPLKITGVWIDPKPGNQSYEAVLTLTARDASSANGVQLNWKEFRSLPDAIFAINNTVIPSGIQYDSPDDADAQVSSITGRVFVAPDVLSGTSLLIAVRWPFFGADWSLHYQSYNSVGSVSVARYASAESVDLLIYGRDFGDDQDVSVVIDQTYRIGRELTRIAPDVLKLELPQNVVAAHRQLLLCGVGKATVALAIPPADEAVPVTIDRSKKPPVLKANADTSVDFAGTGLLAVRQVRLHQRELKFVAYSAGSAISVVVDGQSIPVPGTYDIEFETKSGLRLTAPIIALQDAAKPAAEPPDAKPPAR